MISISRSWNEFKRNREGETTNRGEYYYYYLLGWCAISIVIAFLLLPPLSTTKTKTKTNDIATTPHGQLASWFALLSTPSASSPLSPPSAKKLLFEPKILIAPSNLTTQPPLNTTSYPQTLEPPTLTAPSATEILSPMRYPESLTLPKTTPTGLTLHPNGHLLLHISSSPLQRHPFLILMDRAKLEWEAKVKRQSKSLKECVEEYRRRYGRKPPKGFDKWYAYAVKHHVVLVDEYDQISRDLFPFWALSPTELHARAQILRERQGTRRFEITFSNGTWIRSGPFADLDRVKRLVKLFQIFTKDLAESNLNKGFDVFMEDEDRAQILLGWDQSKRLFELAALGHYLPKDYKVATSNEGQGPQTWATSCPPFSPLRLSRPSPLEDLMKSANHSWIANHVKAMDLCTDPERIDLHGATATGVKGPQPILPMFAFSKTSLNADMLITPLEQYSTNYPGKEISWGQRPYQKLYWRGSTTGMKQPSKTPDADSLASCFDRLKINKMDQIVRGNDHNPKWVTSHRMRLYRFTHEANATARVLFGGDTPSNTNITGKKEDPVREVEISRAELNAHFMNVTFVNRPIQCETNVCELLSKTIDFSPPVSSEEVGLYKYALDVDGNGWSGRFHRLLSTKHLVIKSTILPEWYAERIQPWYHYIPSKVDYSDLYDIMSFFSGGLKGAPGHDREAEVIARQGQDWARKHWREEDMAAYMFRLFLEWNRVYNRNDNGDSEDFDEELF